MQSRKISPQRAYCAILVLFLAICAPGIHAQIIINEIDSDTPGTDSLDFIELYDGGTGNVSLDGLVLVFYNGLDGLSDRAIDLSGQSTNAAGYFVVGSQAVQNVDLIIPNTAIQNGPDAVALYNSPASNFPNDTAVSTDNLIDAIVYGTDDPDNEALLALLNPGQPQADESGGGDKDNHSLQRIPNGSGGPRNSETFSPAPPTPGTANGVDSEPVEFNLEIRITPEGAGSFALDPDRTMFADGESVSVAAVPAPGYVFSAWNGDIGGNNPASNIIELVMDQDRTIEAEFAEISIQQYTLTIDVIPEEGGQVQVDPQMDTYDNGEQVTLTATPAAGFEFAGWSGDIGGNDAGAPSIQIVMDQDKNIEAEFTEIQIEQYTLTIEVLPEGAGQVRIEPAKPTYEAGAEITLTALPASGYNFSAWSGDIEADDPGQSEIRLIMDNDKHVVAIFSTGTAPAIEVDPTSLDFGKVKLGSMREMPVVISNFGDKPLQLSGADLRGDSCNQWNIVDFNAPTQIQPGRSIEITVSFRPLRLGEHSAILVLVSNDPETPELKVELSGMGCGSQIILSRKFVKFRRHMERSDREHRFELRNDGDTKLHLARVWLEDVNGNSIAIPATDVPTEIEPGSSVELAVSHPLLAVAGKLNRIRIESDAPAQQEIYIDLNNDVDRTDVSGVIINEIHYNPAADQGSDNQFEFIELFNKSGSTAYLNGVAFRAGIEHTFAATDSIEPLGFLVLSRDTTIYPGSLLWQSGSLVNQGEALVLVNSVNGVIDSVSYGASSPWPAAPNGQGPSLELMDPDLENSLAGSWQASDELGGTPGRPNSMPVPTETLDVLPARIDFGTITVGDSGTAGFHIINRTSTQASILAIATEGDSAAFAVVPSGGQLNIPPMDSLAVKVNFLPNHSGSFNAVIRVLTSAPSDTTLLISVTGIGHSADSVSVFDGTVVINEIHYNPSADQGSDNAYEFVELHNAGGDSINLFGFAFTAGIEHAFQDTVVLPPGSFIILARDSSAYEGSIQWASGSLLNGGEMLELKDSLGATVDQVMYSSAPPWPAEANGAGNSLELIEPDLDNLRADSWQASYLMGGTPGLANSVPSDSTEQPTKVREAEHTRPEHFSLAPNFPNPFNPSTQVTFQLPERAAVGLFIFNLKGERVRTLLDGNSESAGIHDKTWNATDDFGQRVASGVYILQFVAKGESGRTFSQSRKMTLLK